MYDKYIFFRLKENMYNISIEASNLNQLSIFIYQFQSEHINYPIEMLYMFSLGLKKMYLSDIHPVHRIYASMFFMIIAMIILSVDYETLSQPYLQPQKTNISAAAHSSTHKAFRQQILGIVVYTDYMQHQHYCPNEYPFYNVLFKDDILFILIVRRNYY